MFGALKRGFRSMAGLILVRNVVGELRPKKTLAASRSFLAAARLSCTKKVSRTAVRAHAENQCTVVIMVAHFRSIYNYLLGSLTFICLFVYLFMYIY